LFNKYDVFAERVKTSDIKKFFPVRPLLEILLNQRQQSHTLVQDFDGEAGDVSAGLDYFTRRFINIARDCEGTQDRQIHVQCVYLSIAHCAIV